MTSNDLTFNLNANNNTNHAFNQVGQNLNHLGQQGAQAGGATSGALDGVKGALGKLGGIAAGAGTAIAAGLAVATGAAMLLGKALGKSIERTQAAQLASAQLGGDPNLYKQVGKIAGKVYGDNFTASIQDASIAVRDVIRNKLLGPGATDGAIADLTERLSTVATLFEDSTDHVASSVSQMLRTGLAKNADEALDIVTVGLQQGADKAQDLLDTLNEYGTQFRKFGLDGKTATGLLVQGLQAGARDADIVADAIKEFSIRAVDGSKSSAEGFKALGLDAKKMGDQIGKGGDSATAGLDLVLDKLRAIEDPVKRAQVAVQLFGTQAEDLGEALFALDPSEAVKALGAVEGAAKKASDTLGNNLGSTIDGLKRKLEMGFADFGDKLAPIVSGIVAEAGKLGASIRETFKGSPVPAQVMDALRELKDSILPAVSDAFRHIAKVVQDHKSELESFGNLLAKVIIPLFKEGLVVAIGYAVTVIDVAILAVAAFGKAWEFFKTKVFPVIAEFVRVILDMYGVVVNGATKAFGWIPGVGDKLRGAADDFDRFKNDVNGKLNAIQKEWNVNVTPRLTGVSSFQNSLNNLANWVAGRGISAGLSARASGGPVTKGVPYIVGEDRPEIFVPDTNGKILPNTNMLAGSNGGGSGGNGGGMTITFAGDTDSSAATSFIRMVRENKIRFSLNGSQVVVS